MSPGTKFFTKNLSTQEANEEDQDRLQDAWGNRHTSTTDYHHARDGDHLIVPFECDTCIFIKLKQRHPEEENNKDVLLCQCIRRINLDAFWSRASSTVLGNRDKIRAALKLSEQVGLVGPYEHTGRLPFHDHCGYEVAIQMVLASLKPGKYSPEYSQWDTIRKVRTAYSNHAKSTPQENCTILALSDERGHAQRLVGDKCSSYWFARFFAGCRRRMGQDWRPNLALSTDLIVMVLRKAALKMDDACGEEDYLKWLCFGTYLTATYVLSLRGTEGLLVDLKGMIANSQKGGADYFVVALLGKVKGEHHDRCHLLPCANTTSSGINVKGWLSTLVSHRMTKGHVDGPLFVDIRGKVLRTQALDDCLIEILEELYDRQPSLFPPSISGKEDLGGSYQVFRTPRRSSDTRALEANVSSTDIDMVNRWHKVEGAKGNRPAFSMKQHYAQIQLLIQPFVRYTHAM
jgi:hypothetical protein